VRGAVQGLCLSIKVKVRPSLKVTETRRSEKAAADSLKMFLKITGNAGHRWFKKFFR
jgi:hypothetical protein